MNKCKERFSFDEKNQNIFMFDFCYSRRHICIYSLKQICSFARFALSGATLTDMRLLLNFTHNIHREKQGCTSPLSEANINVCVNHIISIGNGKN